MYSIYAHINNVSGVIILENWNDNAGEDRILRRLDDLRALYKQTLFGYYTEQSGVY